MLPFNDKAFNIYNMTLNKKTAIDPFSIILQPPYPFPLWIPYRSMCWGMHIQQVSSADAGRTAEQIYVSTG